MQTLPINMEILGPAVYVLERYKLDFLYLVYILNTTQDFLDSTKDGVWGRKSSWGPWANPR